MSNSTLAQNERRSSTARKSSAESATAERTNTTERKLDEGTTARLNNQHNKVDGAIPRAYIGAQAEIKRRRFSL